MLSTHPRHSCRENNQLFYKLNMQKSYPKGQRASEWSGKYKLVDITAYTTISCGYKNYFSIFSIFNMPVKLQSFKPLLAGYESRILSIWQDK